MKTFFNKYGAYQEEGRQLDSELMGTVKAILDKWTALGYSAREIGWLMADTCHCMAAEYTLRNAMKMRKAEKNDENRCFKCENYNSPLMYCKKYNLTADNAKIQCDIDYKAEKMKKYGLETKCPDIDKHYCTECCHVGSHGAGCNLYNPSNDKKINHIKICKETNTMRADLEKK